MQIKIDNIEKSYNGKTRILTGINMEMGEGVFGLVGRNGAGKTTLLRILATVLEPSKGEVMYDEFRLSKNKKEICKNIGYLPQDTELMPYMHIREFLDYMAVLKGIYNKAERKAEVDRCLRLVGLEEEGLKKLKKYSGGMLRRAGIAQAMLGNPKLLIVDEPTTGLDPEERQYFMEVISRIALERTVIFSTHIIADLEDIAKEICVLEKGNIIYKGDIESLKEELKGRLWEVAVDPREEESYKSKLFVTASKAQRGLVYLRYVADEKQIPGSVAVKASIEDAYIYKLGGMKR